MALIPGMITFFVVIHSHNGDMEQKNSRTHIILGIFSVLNSKHIILDQYQNIRNIQKYFDAPSTKVDCDLVEAASSSSHLTSWENMRILH